MVIQLCGVQGKHGIVDDRRAAETGAELGHGHPRCDTWRQAKDDVVETARGESFRRRDHIKPNSAAKATVFQDRRPTFEQLAVTVNAPQDQ
ncbi:hypothetical protein GCM10010052_04420 [Paenarthrobacter histidinolovorans]|nr:hypothetical protein GCM10010052_04420 [Paenarthrobacter histidinolovorans]